MNQLRSIKPIHPVQPQLQSPPKDSTPRHFSNLPHDLDQTELGVDDLLLQASVTGPAKIMTEEDKAKPVRVQWDPERSVRLEMLPYRSTQIGVSGVARTRWVEEWIESIEDVTAMARSLKKVLDEDGEMGEEELIIRGLIPKAKVYELDQQLRLILEMNER
ncbi:MAG: hypothetical protein Q9176_007724 [Flavoplaca citrina]